MSRQLCELETVLQQMIVEHRRLLAHLEKHESAMKAFDLKAMDEAARLQETSRQRIVQLEQRRRQLALELARGTDTSRLTIRKIAELNAGHADALLRLGAELKGIVVQICTRTQVTGMLTLALLGHLNTVVRLIAGAVEKAGLYTKHGIPQVSSRIGVMEAVG